MGVRMPTVRDLPRGTVTFLFTDIEDSTALWEHDETAARAVIARHLALLDDAIAAHGGHRYHQTGDATQSAFATAPAALAAAIAAQQALRAEPWGVPPQVPVRVRMALHTGEAAPDAAGAYHEVPALNRLSRLLRAAYGGQILLSRTTRHLIGGELAPGVALRDLGEYRLRDLLESEQIWQVLAPGLVTSFPPPRTLEQHATNLPTQLTPLVGRGEEVAHLAALLEQESVRLVTLTGPGGTGKTRLALAVAADSLDAFPEGVWFVDLAPLADAALVMPAIAAVLGVREVSGQSLPNAVAAFLEPKRALLVLDNCEQVLDAAPQIADVLQACPRLAILATSREPLQIRAERQIPVAPLALPESDPLPPLDELARVPAVELFVQRVRANQPQFALSADNAAAIAAITRRLDGLPLAIELAAARARILPPAALLERLDPSLPLLTSGARDAPQRQRTLRDAIAWSHALLEDDEPALFRRLAVFVGGWTLDAAAAVASPDDAIDVVAGLTALVDKSLVRPGADVDDSRFGMLETIREFGLEQLRAAGEEEATRARHAEYMVRLAAETGAELFRTTRPELLQRLAAEQGNARAALAWLDRQGETEQLLRLAVGLGWFWFIRGFGSEGRFWLERARTEDPAVAAPVRAWALIWANLLGIPNKDWAAAAELARLSLDIWRSLGEASEGMVMALIGLGRAEAFQGDLAKGTALLEEALVAARTLDNPIMIGAVLDVLAEMALLRGEAAAAAAFVDEAIALQRTIGRPWGVSFSLALLGEIALDRADLPAAVGYYCESMAIARDLGDTTFLGAGLAAIGIMAAERGNAEQAARLLGAAEVLRETSGAWALIAARRPDRHAPDQVRAALGEEFAAAWAAGRALPRDQAIAEALRTAEEMHTAPAR
jgi:predicted ATPase/class 3 adenylate cyclase